MRLQTFLQSLTAEQKRKFASDCGVSLEYLRQIAGSQAGNGKAYRRATGDLYQASAKLSLRIERVSRKYGHEVTRYEMRPDLYPLHLEHA